MSIVLKTRPLSALLVFSRLLGEACLPGLPHVSRVLLAVLVASAVGVRSSDGEERDDSSTKRFGSSAERRDSENGSYPWMETHATVIETGDLQWAPHEFKYRPVGEVRYIDYESGDDSADGKTRQTAWKHHPWDTRATGEAATAEGPKTYVFKRGSIYRIASDGGVAELRADESGRRSTPIRLTSDPSWGEGEAVLAGSIPIDGPWRKSTVDDAPTRLDVQSQTVWYVDLRRPLAPAWNDRRRMDDLTLFEVTPSGETHDLAVASDVGWTTTHPDFAMHHWNRWDGVRDRKSEPVEKSDTPTRKDPAKKKDAGKNEKAPYDKDLVGLPADYFDGGTLWSQYAWVIATPTPHEIKPGDYQPETGTIRHPGSRNQINPGTRYLIEDLPQFLDQPGEFYYDNEHQRLFVRLPEDRDPNNSRLELSTGWETLSVEDKNHIEVSGLTFCFNGRSSQVFNFDAKNVIAVKGNCRGIRIEHCRFHHLANDAISITCGPDQLLDEIAVTDCDFQNIHGGTAIAISGDSGKAKEGQKLGELRRAEVLRNRCRRTGMLRHDDHRWSNVPAIACEYPRFAHVAGNMVDTAFGSGIVVLGGAGGKGNRGWDIPLTRIFVHHNKIEYTALGVNDYGGLSIWQHGPVMSYCNVVGNAVGHWPGGFFNSGDNNLSYPIYLDGAFKIYNFNNIAWGRPADRQNPYASTSAAYFNVFGYMNPLVNNTISGSAIGVGGTSGNRNDNLGNLFTEVHKEFISVNHGGNPSLIGGDDTGKSGIDGAGTLAYAENIFHGSAEAGVVATVKRGAEKDLQADTIPQLAEQMQEYPVRLGTLGQAVDSSPITTRLPAEQSKPSASDADFRPAEGSAAIDAGSQYFIPWPLAATVGEWHFNENRRDPETVLDFHYYPTEAYFNRSMYYRVPVYELVVNDAAVEDYVSSPSEDWCAGALRFDGRRSARVEHDRMTADVRINARQWKGEKNSPQPPSPWIVPDEQQIESDPDAAMVYPGSLRRSPHITTSDLLIEAHLKVEESSGEAVIAGKHDGQTGYQLRLDPDGRVAFKVAADEDGFEVVSPDAIDDGRWHHVLAELDRSTGRTSLYVDGKNVRDREAEFGEDVSLGNQADFVVGTDANGTRQFRGAIDFLRVCQSTLDASETSIEELTRWQNDGPHTRDFSGRTPHGRRDAGAIERVSEVP